MDQRLQHQPTTLNLIEEKVGSTLKHMGKEDYFLNITPVAQTLRATINKWNFIILGSFCKAKDIVDKTKQQSTEWKKNFFHCFFTDPTADSGLISKITN